MPRQYRRLAPPARTYEYTFVVLPMGNIIKVFLTRVGYAGMCDTVNLMQSACLAEEITRAWEQFSRQYGTLRIGRFTIEVLEELGCTVQTLLTQPSHIAAIRPTS